MEKICHEFIERGNNILKSSEYINNGTQPIQCPFEDFEKACNSIIAQKDNTAGIAGICFNIAPYVSINFQNINPKAMWQLLIQISNFINDFPIAYGYLESVTELAIKCHKIDEEFLEFLINPEIEVHHFIKPLLLAALFDFLPDSFIFDNREYFLPLILDAFTVNDFLYRCNFLLIITEMQLDFDIIKSIPNFGELMWNFAFEAAASDSDYSTFQVPFSALRKQIPEFFELASPIISSKLKDIDENTLYMLIRLLPFFYDIDIVNEIIQALHNFINTTQSISKQLNQAVYNSMETDFHESIIEYLFTNFSRDLMKDFDATTIYIFSLYYPIFEDYSKDSALMLVNAINLAFAGENPNLEILCFSIERIADQYKTRSQVLQGSVIPALLKTFLVNDDSIVRYASRALIELTKTETIQPKRYLNDYLSLFQAISESNISDYSLIWMKKYFKVIKCIISLEDNKSNEMIFDFITKFLLNPDFPLILKGFFLELITSLFVTDTDISEHIAEIAPDMNFIGIAQEFLLSDISSLYPIAAEFLFKFDHALDIFKFEDESEHAMYDRLLAISSGNVENTEKKDIRVTSYFTALFSGDKKLPYPIEIIQTLLNDDDEISQYRALINLQHTYQQYSDEEFKQLLTFILNLAKNSKSSEVVNSIFSFLKKIINDENKYALEFSSDLIQATMQGRILLLDHNFPFNYDNSDFKFYSCVSAYINKFKDNSLHIICELLDWVPFCDENVLSKVIKCLNSSLEVAAIPSDLLPILYHSLLTLLVDDFSQNPDLINYILGCLVNLLTLFPGICDPNELVTQMDEKMWDPKDEDMIMILLPIYMDIWSYIVDVPINDAIFSSFIRYMMDEQFQDWDFRMNLEFLMKIVNSERDDVAFDKSAEVLACYILKPAEYKNEKDFDDEFVDNMKQSLNLCCQKVDRLKETLTNSYYRFPKLKNELEKIIE